MCPLHMDRRHSGTSADRVCIAPVWPIVFRLWPVTALMNKMAGVGTQGLSRPGAPARQQQHQQPASAVPPDVPQDPRRARAGSPQLRSATPPVRGGTPPLAGAKADGGPGPSNLGPAPARRRPPPK